MNFQRALSTSGDKTTTSRLDGSAPSKARAAGVAEGERLRLRDPLTRSPARSRGNLLPG